MCKDKVKLTDEQNEALKYARREKRSAFRSRMVDEFKKIGFVATFVFCIIIITWCMVLYTISLVSSESTIIAAVALGLQIVSVTAFGIIGTAFAVYCKATTKEKESLNNNGMVKNSDGTISKIAQTVSTIVGGVTGNSSKTDSDDDAKG